MSKPKGKAPRRGRAPRKLVCLETYWTDRAREFRVEGFYERFPAKGQIERVARLHRDLAKMANIEVMSRQRAQS